MKGYVLLLVLGILMWATTLGCSPLEEPRPPDGAVMDEAHRDKLNVTIRPETNRVKTGETFRVSLRVVNATTKPQSFRVMGCSWYEHWKTDHSRIPVGGSWSCSKNFPVTIKLEPGEAYEKTLRILVTDGPPLTLTSFRMGFTPIGEKTTYWSNKVVLGIKPGKGK